MRITITDTILGIEPTLAFIAESHAQMTVNEILDKLNKGELTPEMAADEFRHLCRQNGIQPPKQFNQKEERLLMGYPIKEIEECKHLHNDFDEQ